MELDTKRCPSCDSPATLGNRICDVCNQPLVSVCSKCGHDVVVWNDRCSYCGSAVEHLIEKSSSRQNVETLRLQAEIRTLEQRVRSKPGWLLASLKALFLILVHLLVLFGVVAGIGAAVFHFYRADIAEYYRSWPIRCNIGIGVVIVVLVVYSLSLVVARLKALRHSVQRAGESWLNAKRRLEEAQKMLERMRQ